MKTDNSIRNITIAAIKRSAMDVETWSYSSIVNGLSSSLEQEYELLDNELPVFEIRSSNAETLITTQRIIERKGRELKFIKIDHIDDVIYGNFKGQPNQKLDVSIFRIVDIYGNQHDFQMETGKASMGLIRSVNTITRLKRKAGT